MCRPPSARRGKLNAFATPLRRVLHRSLRLLARTFPLSFPNRVTVKLSLITASFQRRLLHETRDNHETVGEQAAPVPEKNVRNTFLRGDVDCNGKIRNKFREKFFRRVHPVPLLLYLLLRDKSETLPRAYPPFFAIISYVPLCILYVQVELINDFPRILKYRNGN